VRGSHLLLEQAPIASGPFEAALEPVDMSTLAEIQELIHTKYGLDPAKLDPNASLRESGVDSLTLVEVLFAIEDHYGISVPEKYSDIDTVAALAAAVDEIRAAQTTA
jgi:acyl carrier protein